MFEKFQKMNLEGYRTSYEQLNDFVFRMQENKFDWGDEQRERIVSLEDLQTHNQKMREGFIQGIGGLIKDDSPLNAKVVRKSEEEEFILETIIFNSRPGVYVTASLYLPKGIIEPTPAVLFLCGHTLESRIDPGYQRVCHTLARAGLVVFAFDPPGQGERADFYDPASGKYLIPRGSLDHDMSGVPAVATGKFLIRQFIHDQMRAVDYMQTRPEIDPNRIGVTGQSGGGMTTLTMMTCDKRIAAAAPVTWVTNRRSFLYTGHGQDSEQVWPGMSAIGFDHTEPFLLFAPRPVQILASTSDYFSIEGTRETYAAARRIYKLFGKEENIRIFEDNNIHDYTANMAIRAAEFFTEVFFGAKRTVTNDDFKPLKKQEMLATKTGNTLGEFEDIVTIPDEVRECAVVLRQARHALSQEERTKRASQWLREKVEYNRSPVAFNLRRLPKGNSDIRFIEGYMGFPISWWTQRRLFSFGIMIRKAEFEDQDALPTVIAIWPDGTQQIAAHEEWIRRQCDEGKQVLIPDVPGTGSIEQRPMSEEQLKQPYKGRDGVLFKLCHDLIYSGDNLAAMHCYDVLRTIDMLKEEFGVREEEMTLYCEGQDGVYGIMAGFLNKKVTVEQGPQLLMSVEREILGQKALQYDNTLSLIVPGMLEYFDYEELL